ncbi:MAG: enoyl-CoA hydratase/isomerase family protein [Flavisolibacter sp.]
MTALDKGMLTATINRPDKLNALNREVFDDLDVLLKEMASNREIRAVILTGAGQKSFVAGADISEFTGLTVAEGMALARRGQEIFARIEQSSIPVVAAVNGFALGGGCELAMACHFRIASDNARFGQPEVNLGLIPGYGGTQRLVQLVGKGRALELLMTGNMIDASIALEYGLVNHVVPQDDLLPKARMVVEQIITKAPLAISRCITAANAVFSQENGYEVEIRSFGACFGTEDMIEGTAAFLEKRKPHFKGR